MTFGLLVSVFLGFLYLGETFISIFPWAKMAISKRTPVRDTLPQKLFRKIFPKTASVLRNFADVASADDHDLDSDLDSHADSGGDSGGDDTAEYDFKTSMDCTCCLDCAHQASLH